MAQLPGAMGHVEGPRGAGKADEQGWGESNPTTLKGVHYKQSLVATSELKYFDQIVEMAQQQGFEVNGFRDNPNKMVVSFDLGGDLESVDKSSWPLSRYIRAPGPSVQIVREGLTEKIAGCCSEPQAPQAERLNLWFRPADIPEKGSQQYQKYVHEGEIKFSQKKYCCCECCCNPCVWNEDIDEWSFKNQNGQTLTYRRLFTMVAEEDEDGKKKPKKVFPTQGVLWQLLKDGETIASLEIPGKMVEKTSCGCCKKMVPENPDHFDEYTVCCSTEYTLKNPKMFMRVFSASTGATMFAIRNQVQPEVKPKSPGCCSPEGCHYCCEMCGCAASCASCLGCCMINCAKEGPIIPIYATATGFAKALKRKGQRVHAEDEDIHNIHDADVPARPAIPAQDKMVVYHYPALAAAPAVKGYEHQKPTIMDWKGKDMYGHVVIDRILKDHNAEVRKGDILAYATVKPKCCGCPCYCGEMCPKDNCCAMIDCKAMCGETCAPCVQCCGEMKMCCECKSATCAMCCPCCCTAPEGLLEYSPLPVTGEWANSEKEVYRIRAETYCEQATGSQGLTTVADVLAGLEEGTNEAEHTAFSLVNFLELFQDHRRPGFHIETDPAPAPSKGLPPRVQLKLTKAEVEAEAAGAEE